MKRAWFSGALAVFLAHLGLVGLIIADARVGGLMPAVVAMLLGVMNVAGLGAFITARRAPERRLLAALTMAPLTAVLGTASNLLLGLFGVRADLSGFYNDAGLFAMLLTYGVLTAAVGGALGAWRGGSRAEVAVPVAAMPEIVWSADGMSALPAKISRDDLPQIRSD